jgi:hypothetical protein
MCGRVTGPLTEVAVSCATAPAILQAALSLEGVPMTPVVGDEGAAE